MSIKEYKEKIIATVKQMELEHGCNVRKVEVDVVTECGTYSGFKETKYEVEIEM